MRAVVVVAEELGVREALGAALRETSVVFIERSVDDALRRMVTVPADLVFLDDTPKLGIEALGRLQAELPGVPIIAVLGRGDTETRASYVVAGASACVTKPFSCDDLNRVIDEVLASPAPRPHTQMLLPAVMSAPATVDRHQTALRWISRANAMLDNPARLAELFVEAMADIFGVARCAVLLENDGAVRVAASQGLSPVVADSLRLSFTAGLMRTLEASPALTDRATVADPNAARDMSLLGARLAVPLLSDGNVVGAFAIGDSPSGGAFSRDDCELLALLARTAGVALENARRYSTVSHLHGQLHTIIARLTSGVVVVAPDKTVSMMNESAEKLLAMRSHDIVGYSVQRLGSAFADVALRAMTEGRPLVRQEVRDPATGSTLGISAAPAGDHGVALIFAKVPQRDADRAGEDVLGSPYWEFLSARVAQEVKNPLVAINTFAQLLPRKYESPDFRTQFSDVVQKEVTRINRVVETLYDFARPPRLARQRSSVNEIVTNVLSTFEDKLRAANISLTTDYDMSNPIAELDPLYFAQALHNVIQNAYEMMPEGGKLKVDTRARGGACEVTVSDSGPGIDAENAPLVFLPFFSTRETGMGLGLSVAHRIMRQHQGDLRLVSSKSGSTFVFLVPIGGSPKSGAHVTDGAPAGVMNEDSPGR
ncbi:MAG: GAF domain-containing protein [Candidatus Hydrogenedentes bacterium]|nr:GAF domain-containing protein [Candidatus Hydrogenedentota bacterium]